MASARLLDKTHDTLILDGIRSLYQQDKLTDVTLTSKYEGQEHSVECHKVILAAVSEFFRQKFISAERCGEVNIVHLENISPEVLKAAVTYVYKGKCAVRRNLCEELLSVGDSWKLEGLKKACFQRMINTLDDTNVIRLYEVALQCDAEPLVLVKFVKVIWENLKKFHENDMINTLSITGFRNVLLFSCNTPPTSASTTYHSIMKWSTAHPDDDVTNLLDLVKYDDIPNDELVQILPKLVQGGYAGITTKVQEILTQALKAAPGEPRRSMSDPVNSRAVEPDGSKEAVPPVPQRKVPHRDAIPQMEDNSELAMGRPSLLSPGGLRSLLVPKKTNTDAKQSRKGTQGTRKQVRR